MEKITVVARSFQAGTGKEEGKVFDENIFKDKVAKPINNLLRFTEVIKSIVIVTNGEAGNKLAEVIGSDSKTPTIRMLEKTFPGEIKSGKIIPHICQNWGNNPGSATALNEGLALSPTIWSMCWSPEIEMDGYRITSALNLAEKNNLSVVGFLRKRWWEKAQWNVVQNTACIWNLESLRGVDYFSPDCNGIGKSVTTPEFGDVPLAGMEDFHAMLRMMKQYTDDFRWGLVGRTNPLHWDTSFVPGSERELNHLKKVARQYLVMMAYAREIFPTEEFEDLMDKFFAIRHQD